MYIPSLLFGGVDNCVSASGHDETGIFLSGSQVWEYYKFTSTGSGSLTIHSGSSTNAKIFVVAGGGAGGVTEFNGEALNESAGGGGAGGVVFTDARLGVGTYNLYVGTGSSEASSEGEDSWIDINYVPTNFDDAYVPTGSHITAEGGGYGGWFKNLNNTSTGKVDASSGGSGGGGCASLRFVGGYTIANSASGRTGQGFQGGTPQGNLCNSIQENTATGGGGAGGASPDTDCVNSAGYQTPGGDGLVFNVDGTNTKYACGGASMRKGTWEAAPGDTQAQSSRMYGAGGWGRSSSYGSSKTGRQGIIVVMIPLCSAELSVCNEYFINGGANGGNITFIPCGQNELETITVDPLDKFSICSYTLPPFPSGSGDVVSTNTGSCSSYSEPPNPPSCPSGSSLEPLYLTQLDISAPDVGPYPGFMCWNWLDFDGNTQSECYGSGTHNICAQSGSVTVSTLTVGSSATVTLTGTQCGYYCSGSA